MEKLAATRKQLAPLKPEFFSVTFGAGGSTQDRTLETIRQIKAEGYNAAPHLSCVGSTRDNIRAMLNTYKDMGIKRIVALRGDLPSGMASIGEFQYANELVSFIRAQTGDHFHIEVAAYPEVPSAGQIARKTTSSTSSARSMPGRIPRSPSISTTPMPTSASSMSAASWVSPCPSCRASCPS